MKSQKMIREMWTDLGLDLERHDQLIEEMEKLHTKIFLSQSRRPETMARFDASYHASHAERVAEVRDFKKQGGRAIGTFCIYVPDEIALAADVLPVPLCGGSDWPMSYADKLLPRDICPLIRSTFGMALSKTCPYATLLDADVGETTCDAKKKAWDLFGFEILEVPQKKGPMDKDLWLNEVVKFRELLEKLSGVSITAERLRSSVRRMNRKREVLQEINDFRKLKEPPISGLDALLVSQVSLNQDLETFIGDCEALIEELRDRAAQGVSAYEQTSNPSRIMIAGSPSPLGNAKVHHIVESAGLRIVVDESCTGTRYYRNLVDETSKDLDGLIRAVADRYFQIDCSCFSPNTERMDSIVSLCEEYAVDGVVQNILQYCHTYNIEARVVEKTLKKLGLPSLTIVTDYSQEDYGQLRTRVEAFAEILGS